MTHVCRTIIMLSGWMQSGKDTVGDYLCKSFGFTRFAFADVLKDEASEMFHVDRDSLDTSEGKDKIYNVETGATVREELLIAHGQNRRAQNIDYWVEKVIASIEKKEADDPYGEVFHRIVITDWRFPNEYNRLHKYVDPDNDPASSIHSWRIDRWPTPPLDDPTERALDDFEFDQRITNKGTVDDLYEKIRGIMYQLPDFNIRILLTDIDEVLLKWIEGFAVYVKGKGYTLTHDYPSTWLLHTWVLNADGSPMTPEEVKELALTFNHSDEFEHLTPCDHAADALACIKSRGFHIVGISSCTDDADAAERRKKNLQTHFGDTIDNMICLPLGASKKETLKQFSSCIWIDDNPENVKEGTELGHFAFIMKRPWNEADVENENMPVFMDWSEVKEYVLIEEALQELNEIF